jgi:hypothetical protein
MHLADSLANDLWHEGQSAEQWQHAAGGLTTFYDEKGPLFHFAFDYEPDGTLRCYAQFGNAEKLRITRGLVDALDKIENVARMNGLKRIVFSSHSPRLVKFFERLGFMENGDDLEIKVGN